MKQIILKDDENRHSHSVGMINDAFTEDWDMILDTETMAVQENTEDNNQEAVDIVIRLLDTISSNRC